MGLVFLPLRVVFSVITRLARSQIRPILCSPLSCTGYVPTACRQSGSPLRFGIRKFDMLRKITFRHLFRGQRDTQARVSLQDATTALQNDARTSPTPSPQPVGASRCTSPGIWRPRLAIAGMVRRQPLLQVASGFFVHF